MNICKLCQQNEADKKGSHIIPFFLLREVENIDGKKERNYEIGFSLGGSDVKSYFGSSILPERLEETFGEIQDEDIEANKHPMIVDHLLCTSCEKRFSVLESIYSKYLANNNEEVAIDSNISYLFWISVFWRLGVIDNNEVHLPENLLEKYRNLLINSLSEENIISDEVDHEFKFYFLKVQDIDDGTFTYPFYSDGVIGLIVGSNAVLIVIDDSHNEIENKVLMEIVNYLDCNKINERKGNTEKRILISNEQYSYIRDQIIIELAPNINDFKFFIEEALIKLIPECKYDHDFIDFFKDLVINIYFSNEHIPIGRRYTLEHQNESVLKGFKVLRLI